MSRRRRTTRRRVPRQTARHAIPHVSWGQRARAQLATVAHAPTVVRARVDESAPIAPPPPRAEAEDPETPQRARRSRKEEGARHRGRTVSPTAAAPREKEPEPEAPLAREGRGGARALTTRKRDTLECPICWQEVGEDFRWLIPASILVRALQHLAPACSEWPAMASGGKTGQAPEARPGDAAGCGGGYACAEPEAAP